ncbi:MAG: hypothetical protein V1656_03350 [Candidatus Jorgensenbacteria bacterium]
MATETLNSFKEKLGKLPEEDQGIIIDALNKVLGVLYTAPEEERREKLCSWLKSCATVGAVTTEEFVDFLFSLPPDKIVAVIKASQPA